VCSPSPLYSHDFSNRVAPGEVGVSPPLHADNRALPSRHRFLLPQTKRGTASLLLGTVPHRSSHCIYIIKSPHFHLLVPVGCARVIASFFLKSPREDLTLASKAPVGHLSDNLDEKPKKAAPIALGSPAESKGAKLSQ
jgi:hypothetical protein